MFGRRKTRDGVQGNGSAEKPLTLQERLNCLESGDVLLEYPAGLLQPFSRQELGRLKKRFVHLIPPEDASRDLRLPLANVLEMPELRAEPFVPLVAQLVLERAGGNQDDVSFSAFLTILAVFSAKQSLEVKRQVLFDVYDHDAKGCATVDDFVRVISAVSYFNGARRKAMRQEVQLRLAPLIKQSKSDKSGVLFNDFCQLMVKWHIGTYARLRPPRRGHDCAKFDLERVDDGRFSRTVIAFPPPDEDESRMHLKQRDGLDFHFNDVFDPSVSQEQVFNEVCLDIVQSALDGYNGTILAYGQTGSGKTYTITGGEHYADRGIIPRVLSTIFEEFERRPNMRYSCYISYLEIYNESVYDLLDRSHTDRPIEEWTKVLLMDDDEGDMHFRNLGVFEAVSEEEALNLLFLGNMNRVTSDTPMNQASSRSHSIFSVMIESRPVDSDMIVTSKLHLVDLAGSERVYKRDGTQRMRSEGKHINLSLHHLEQVILSLRSKRNAVSRTYHIPYRNSMLTSVLRGSLGGNCKSVFIATLNPESDFADESISTCRFMQRCSEVAVDIAVNTEVDTEKRLESVEKLNAELEATNAELQRRAEQLDKEIQAQAQHIAKQEQQWERRLTLAQEETQAALVAAKRARERSEESGRKVDWMQCEEIVERLLLTGDLPREELDKPRSEGEFEEARLLYETVAQGIRELGMTTALGCLVVLKENTFFASNTAAELQELMSKQTRTVEVLEQRLTEQKREAELLREQIQNVAESQKSDRGARTSIPRSKSHTGTLRKRRTSHRRTSDSGRGDSVGDRADSNSGSDSENDSEASETHEYDRPSAARLQSSATAEPPPRGLRAAKRSEYSNASISEEAATDEKQVITRAAVLATDPTEFSVPPPAGSPRKSGSDLIRRRMELLRNGSLFVKYGRFGKPHVRFVWCSADLEYLNYRKVNSSVPKATIPTRSIMRICIGQDTRVFERAKQPGRAPHCFSVEYEENRTLDLEIADGESPEVKKVKRNDWVEALQFLIKLKVAPHRKSTPPRDDSAGSFTA